MADLAKVILPSGDEYNFKDAQAREQIQSELNGETSTVTGDFVTFETESAQVLPSVVVDIDPVQNGSGDPSPTNVRPISGWDGCTVERVGKNLCPNEFYGYGSSTDYTITINSDGSVSLSGTYTSTSASVIRNTRFTLPAGSYVLSGMLGMEWVGLSVQLLNITSGAIIGYAGYGGNLNFTLTESTLLETRIHITAATAKDVPLNNYTIYPMIIRQDEPNTSFEGYRKDIYLISFPSSAGTVYGGTLDVTNGVLTVMDGAKQVPAGKSYISSVSASEENVTFWIYAPGLVKNTSGDNPICDTLKYNPAGSISALSLNEFSWSTPYPNSFFCRMSTTLVGMTRDSIWEYLQANPLTVCSKLSTPVTYQLTPTQVTALLGQNNLWADTGDVSVVYRDGKNALLQDVADAVHNLQPKLVFDSTPTEGSTNPVTSGGVWNAVNQTQDMLAYKETGVTASRAYSEGEYFYRSGNLCKAIASISSGATFTENTNYTVITAGGFNDLRVKVGSLSLTSTWNGNGPYTQTATITGVTITENSKVDLQLTASQVVSLISDGVTGLLTDNTNGTVTVYAIGAAPLSALTLQCTVTEVG